MKLQIEVFTDNDAFKPMAGPELARILRDLAERVENKNDRAIGESYMAIRDANGNECGTMEAYND